MNRKVVSGLLLILLFLLCPYGISSPTTMVCVEPEIIFVSPGTTFTINITVADVIGLFGWQVKVYFNDTILNCTGAVYPTDHVFAGKLFVPVSPMIEQNYVLFGAVLYYEEDVFNGNGTLCQITFKGKAVGTSDLSFDTNKTYVLNYDLNKIPCVLKNGYVNVHACMTSISVYPFEITVPVGEIFTIKVTLTNVTDLYVWQINLYFDPSILNCTGAWYPDDHAFAGKDIVSVEPVIDNVGGYILYGCCLLGEEETFNGSGTLCQIQFKAVLPWNSTLEFSGPEDTFLLDFDGNGIPNITYEGYVMVSGGLYGDLNNDGKVDLLDIVVAAKAFGSYPGHPRWNPITDVNKDNIVNIIDIVLIAKNFGKTM